MKRTKLALFVALLLFAPVASAGLIEINMAGTDLIYTDPNGIAMPDGTLTTAGVGPDSLGSLTFFEDGSPFAVVDGTMVPLSFDLLVEDIPSIAIPGVGNSTAVTAPAGGSFELFMNNSSVLSLALQEVEVVYSNLSFGIINVRVMFAGSVGSINTQNLPYGIDLSEPVTLSFNLQQATATSAGGYLTGFAGFGGGTVSAERVPEPSSLLIAGLGGLLAIAGVRARAKKK